MRKTRSGWGDNFSRRHRPLSQVAHVFFSLSFFYYVPTILSESLAQSKKGSTVKPLPSGQLWGLP